MKTFRQFMSEKVLSIGLNPKHEKYRDQHKDEMHDMLQKSYVKAGGYSGKKSGSKEESDAIHDDLSNPKHIIKATRRGDKISSVAVYKPQHGRKSIAGGTDGSDQGKADLKKTSLEDHEHKRSWGEVSGAPEHIRRKMGVPVVPSDRAEKLLGKKVKIVDKERYSRKIGDDEHEKVIMGHPKES